LWPLESDGLAGVPLGPRGQYFIDNFFSIEMRTYGGTKKGFWTLAREVYLDKLFLNSKTHFFVIHPR